MNNDDLLNIHFPGWDEPATVLKKVKWDAPLDTSEGGKLSFSVDKTVGIIFPEILHPDNPWRGWAEVVLFHWAGYLVVFLLMLFGFVLKINKVSLAMFALFFLFGVSITGVFCFLSRKFSSFRYLVFQEKKITLCNKRYIRRYPIDAVSLYVVKLGSYLPLYLLELNIPDDSLPVRDRVFFIDLAFTKKNIDRKLVTVLRMLQGKNVIEKHLYKERYTPVEPTRSLKWPFHAALNIINYLSTKLTLQLYSKVMFKIVHGSPEKAYQKYKAALDEMDI